MDVLRTENVDQIHKELAILAIVYNRIRLVILKSTTHQNVPVNQIHFIEAHTPITPSDRGR